MRAPDTTSFSRLAGAFGERLHSVRGLGEPRFVRDDWEDRNRALEEFLLPVPPPDFLSHPSIRFQMFVDERYVERELPFVLAHLEDPALLAEDPVGEPPRIPLAGGDGLLTSSNTVHHVHHVLRYEHATGRRVAAAGTIVEWGAGYGNLAKVLIRRHGGSPTLVLIDTPIFSAVQWLYLASVLGEDRVVLHDEARPVVPGAVNVVPIGLVDRLAVQADLFVSTWALNESLPAAQDLVLDRDFFGADALLLAMHHGDPLEARVLACGAAAHALGDFMPAQRYQLR